MSRPQKKKQSQRTPTNNQSLQRDFSVASIRAVNEGEDNRAFELSFSSEEPCQMWFGNFGP